MRTAVAVVGLSSPTLQNLATIHYMRFEESGVAVRWTTDDSFSRETWKLKLTMRAAFASPRRAAAV